MKRVITLGSGRRVTLGQYVRAVQIAKANPDVWFSEGLCGSGDTGRRVVQDFFRGVQDRIARHIPQREDRVGSYKRLLRRLRRGGRSCKWCGTRFTPRSVADLFCSVDCRCCYWS